MDIQAFDRHTAIMPSPLQQGTRDGLPFLLIILPFGALFGVLATEAGLDLAQTMAFSSLVIAGASQLTALQLMEQGAPTAIVVASALAVNLRMVMYSAALTPHLGAVPVWQRAIAAYLMVDQTYALSAEKFEARSTWTPRDKIAYFAGTALPVFPGWVSATWLGAALGTQVPADWPIDFAVPLAFLALTGPMLKTGAHRAAAFVSVAGALALAWMPWNLGLLIAALAAMATGAEIERRRA